MVSAIIQKNCCFYIYWEIIISFSLLGFTYIGEGTSHQKAKNSAANNFLAHLVQKGLVQMNEVPSNLMPAHSLATNSEANVSAGVEVNLYYMLFFVCIERCEQLNLSGWVWWQSWRGLHRGRLPGQWSWLQWSWWPAWEANHRWSSVGSHSSSISSCCYRNSYWCCRCHCCSHDIESQVSYCEESGCYNCCKESGPCCKTCPEAKTDWCESSLCCSQGRGLSFDVSIPLSLHSPSSMFCSACDSQGGNAS